LRILLSCPFMIPISFSSLFLQACDGMPMSTWRSRCVSFSIPSRMMTSEESRTHILSKQRFPWNDTFPSRKILKHGIASTPSTNLCTLVLCGGLPFLCFDLYGFHVLISVCFNHCINDSYDLSTSALVRHIAIMILYDSLW
jgi:hypothetical protein